MPRLLLIVVLVVAVAWLGFQAVRAFDPERHAREAAAVLSAPDTVTHPLAAAQAHDCRHARHPQTRMPGPPNGRVAVRPEGRALDAVHSPGGRFSHRPGTWLSVVELEGLDQVAEDERYLVFLQLGRVDAGRGGPGGPDGTAQVRSAAEPRPATVYEVVVTRAVDDATSIPTASRCCSGSTPSLGPPRARRFDFALGV